MNKRYYSYNRTHPLAHQYSFGDALKKQWKAPDWNNVNLGGLASGAVGLIGNAINPSGNTSEAGNFLSGAGDVVGMVNPLWGAVVKGVGMLTNAAFGSNVNQEDVAKAAAQASADRTMLSGSGNWDELTNNWNSAQKYAHIGGSQGWFNHDLDNAQNRANEQVNFALKGAQTASANINTNELRNMMNNLMAEGGPIFKTDYDMGLTFINNGGTHEQNPYGGVFMGIAPDGQPNQVEEGEVVFNDYVYSNRLKVPKAVRNKYKLRDNEELSFADAMEDYIKKNGVEERNNDPITNRGLEAFASELAMEQEMLKAKKEMKESRQAANGGHLFADGDFIIYDKKYKNFDELYSPDSAYMQSREWLNADENKAERDALIKRIQSGEFGAVPESRFADIANNWYTLSNDYKRGPVHNALMKYAAEKAEAAANMRALGDLPKVTPEGIVGIRATNRTGNLDDTSAIWNYAANKGGLHNNSGDVLPGSSIEERIKTKQSPDVEGESTYDPTYWWRMAGLGANAAGLAYNIFDPYRPKAVNEIGPMRPIGAGFIGDYMRFVPYDLNYTSNLAGSQNAATRRALMQSGAPGTAASLIANDYAGMLGRGNTYRQALEYNDQFKKAVSDFNRETNKFNLQMALDASARNQSARQDYYENLLKQAQFNSQLDFQHKMMRDQAIGQGITGIADYLNDISKEDVARAGAEVYASTMPTRNEYAEEYTKLVNRRRPRRATKSKKGE